MGHPRSRAIRLAALAALALAAGTAATLLSSSRGPRGSGGSASSGAGAPGGGEPGRAGGASPAGPGAAPRPADLRQGPGDDRVAAVFPPPLPRGNAVLLVTVRRADTGKPAAGAVVRLTQPGPDREARTDTDGFLRMERLLPVHALLRASEAGWRSAARPIALADDSETAIALELQPEVVVSGRVLSEGDGSPVAGACLRLELEPLADSGPWRGRGAGVVQATSGADGSFRIPGGLPDSEVLLVTRAGGFDEDVRWIALPAGTAPSAAVEIRLSPSGVLRGTLRSPDGRPIRGHEVQAWEPRDFWSRLLRTNREGIERPLSRGHFVDNTGEDGSYRIDAVRRGTTYWVAGRRRNTRNLGVPRAVTIPPAGEVALDLVLGDFGTLRLEWDNPYGSPSKWQIRLVPAEGGGDPAVWLDQGNWQAVRTSSASFAAPPGPWRISLVSYQRERILPDAITVIPGQETVVKVPPEVDPDASRSTAVSGTVVNADGRGVPEAGLAIAAAPGGLWTSRRGPSSFHLGRSDAGGTFSCDAGSVGFGPGASVFVSAGVPVHGASVIGPLTLPIEGARIVLQERGVLRGRAIAAPSAVAPRGLSVLFRTDVDALALFHGGQDALVASRTGEFRDGSFDLGNLHAGRGTLTIRTETGTAGPIPVDVPAGGVLDLGPIEIPAGRTAQGRVVDAEGIPVPNAFVRVEGEGDLLPSARTGADGTFLLLGVPSAGDVLRAAAVGYFPARAPCPESGQVTLVLHRGGRVLGTARDAGGWPAAGWRVRARPREGGDEAADVVGGGGRFELDLAPGLHVIELVPEDRSPFGEEPPVARVEVLVRDGRTVTVEIRPDR